MTRQDWLARYRRLFALAMAGQHEEAEAVLLPMTPEAWDGLGKRGQDEVLKLGERLYQERINS